MKGTMISLVLLVVLLGGTTANYFYINHVADRLGEQLECLPNVGASNSIAAIQALLEYWEKQEDIVCLSVEFNTLDRVNEYAATLLACAECGDVYGYQTALTLLRDAIGDLRRLESFSIGNLL